MEKRLVTTPKSFFVKERNQFYSDWTMSFFREDFQNSVDAGSKNIKITITDEKGRGSFDEVGNAQNERTRIVFEDDGHGMSQEVLDKVFFAIGQSTKDTGASVGGFGRARIMTAFSQARYSILTTDRFVMGDGPNYVNYSLDEAERALLVALAGLPGEGSVDAVAAVSVATTKLGLESDLRLVREAIAAGGFKGCRIEVDIEQETIDWQPIPTPTRMLGRLKTYLSESQIPGSVMINGKTPEEFYSSANKIQARRGPAKRTLSAEIGEETIDFATVHTSEGAKAEHKSKLIVRVDGASMYSTDVACDAQVILEIDKELSRRVLNSNRDGLKREFKVVVDEFIAELNIDNTSALADRKSKDNYTIKGEHGMIVARAPSLDAMAIEAIVLEEREAAYEIVDRGIAHKLDTLEAIKNRGISEDAIEEFVRQTYYGDSFAVQAIRGTWDFALHDDISQFREIVDSTYTRDKAVELFLDKASDNLKEWIVSTLSARTAKEMAAVEKVHIERLKDMNDVHVSVVSSNEKTKAAIRRNDPKKWDVETGKGRVPRALLSAWTAACSVAVETLLKARPSTRSFVWTTGWVFSVPEKMDQGDRERTVSIEAMCQRSDDMVRFLINPVTDNGTLKYSVADAKDRQKLIGLAMHEVAHVLEGHHNETYAGILTDIVMEIDIPVANRRMKDAVRAVMAAYETGKARVQAMDDETGRRPAERLMALAAANSDLTELRSMHEDGTYSIDTERLQDHVINGAPSTSDNDEEFYGMAAGAR